MRLALPVVALWVLLGSPANARAAGSAEDLVRRGIELRANGQDEQALAVFHAAQAQKPSPSTLAQVALAQQALGMWPVAEENLVGALGAVQDAWISKNRSALEAALATVQGHLGSLDLRSNVDGAAVFVDGVDRGTLPLKASLRLESGRHVIEVRAPGYEKGERVTTISAGAAARESVTLAALSTPDAAGHDRSSGPALGGPWTRDPTTGATQRTAGIVTIAAGASALIAAGVFLGLRFDATNSFNNSVSPQGGPLCSFGAANQPAQCQGYVDARTRWELAVAISGAAGGALLLTGIVLFASAPRAEPAPTKGAPDAPKTAKRSPALVAVRCAPLLSFSSVGAGCGGQF